MKEGKRESEHQKLSLGYHCCRNRLDAVVSCFPCFHLRADLLLMWCLVKTVFVGNTAALSFLHFLQGTLKQYVGPSGFTDRQHSHNLFELASSDIGAGVFYDDLADQEKDELIQNFLDAVSSSHRPFGQQPADKRHPVLWFPRSLHPR